jgi:hypothetical protein
MAPAPSETPAASNVIRSEFVLVSLIMIVPFRVE